MANTLPVNNTSQILDGALEHHNDCGSASSLMLLKTYGLAKDMTVDQFYNLIIFSGDIALSVGGMQSKMSLLGLRTIWEVDMDMEFVYSTLRSRKPILALIHYAPLVDAGITEKKGFRGAHFLIITGIDLDSVFVNDPYRTDGKSNIAVPISVFEKAWDDCVLDKNPVGGGIIPILPIQDLSVPLSVGDAYTVTVNGLTVRSSPTSASVSPRTIWKSAEPIIYCSGPVTNGYIQLTDKLGWVYCSYIRKV
jgi:hypothetical protein